MIGIVYISRDAGIPVIRFYVIGEKIMYTANMYVKDRTWILSKIKNLRDTINSYALDGYDCMLDDNTLGLNKRIKFYQTLLVIARGRYYSQ